MGSLIGSFHAATVVLHQDQMALTVTADNISQQNSAGYARRVVTWTSGDTVTLSGGVPLEQPKLSIAAQRDAVLDARVAATTSSSAAASTMKQALESLQATFRMDASGQEGSGLGAAMSGFFASMQALAADPSSTSTREAALSAAKDVAGSFRGASAQIAQQAASLDSSVRSAVLSVNQITTSIAALNGQITTAASGADRDAFVDQRSALLANLAQQVGFQQTSGGDGSISLFTSNGAALVVGSTSHALSTAVVSGALHLYSQGSDVTSGMEGGSVGGALSARVGALADTQGRLDGLASTFASAVNIANAAGRTTSGSMGGDIFMLPPPTTHAAASITVLAGTGDAFAAAGGGEGSGGNSNANALAALATQKDTSGATFADTLSAMVSNIGIAAAQSQTQVASTGTVLNQATAARDAVSGISLDTEAANLTQYQRSYQAEAKLLAILNQMMADAINIGTNTAVS